MRYLIFFILLALPRISWHGLEKISLTQSEADALVDSLGRTYFQAKFQLYPGYATSKGIHEFDDRLATFSPRALAMFRRRISRIQSTLESFIEDSLSMDSWIDYNLLKNDMARQHFLLDELKVWQRSPLIYADACIGGIYQLLLESNVTNLEEKVSARLLAIPKVIASARANLTNPIELHCEIAATKIRSFNKFLERLSGNVKLKHIDRGVLKNARSALMDFADLCDSLALTADPDFSLGRDRLVELLDLNGVNMSPEEIIAYASKILKKAKAQAQGGWNGSPARIDSLRARNLNPGEVIDHLYAEIESVKVFLQRNNIVSIPETGEVRIVESPTFLRVIMPGCGYQPPGPFDRLQVGFLFIPPRDTLGKENRTGFRNTSVAEEWDGVIFGEIFPGHHLQSLISNRHQSFIRRMAENSFTIEGWAFYCEELIMASGYHSGETLDHNIGGTIFRAAGAIADAKMHLGEFSLEDAVDFIVNETGVDRKFAETEVKRYAVCPTEAMSYLIGRKKILEIRDEVKRIEGEQFNLREFHDTVLGCGQLPPDLLRLCVTSEAIRSG